jgi:hypothetical protein
MPSSLCLSDSVRLAISHMMTFAYYNTRWVVMPEKDLSLNGERFIPCRRDFFLPVRVLSRLLRRLVSTEACCGL